MRLLIAEADTPVASFLRKGFEAEGYSVVVACDGKEAMNLLGSCEYDLVILDVNLPLADGFQVLRDLRSHHPLVPALFLTARNRVEDRVRGLDLGADDYVVKPFSFSELSARVRGLLRRGLKPAETELRVEDLEVDRIAHSVRRAGRRIELTPKEFALLDYLARNAGHSVSRAKIIEHVWDLSFDTMTNVVDVYINYLRRKIDAGFDRKLIRTVRGIGYQIGESKAA